MNKMTDSDLTMVANKHFDTILSSVGRSCLNYSIQVSPFSATISLRKTLAKDRTGASIIPSHVYEDKSLHLANEKSALEDELRSLRIKYEELLSTYASTNNNLTLLQNSLKERDSIILDFIAAKKADQKVVEDIQAELCWNKARFKEEVSCILKERNDDVILWRQEFDKIMTNHRNLEYKYQNLSEKCGYSVGGPQLILLD